ncbi:MAG: reverse transcriptase domain-containing protein [Thermaerobacter sp.]|jgi:group II intron reverse transcriptase/maturase|uniref:RNA-directed DNA polymerase n=1 Tax=Sulfobacillus thermotolerans TaxID=338644 RepID=G5CJ09_9FIRM|nr:reverse transcriptase/maturase family protein [Sulfobacillus thermotolerans]AEP14286.1 RNA-directed DNA polymerase [Sulfobacillus thermotolerans]MDA8204738.1 reverse transcriptase domain-containing protein [Thermaerobacter sp.]
MRQPQVVLEQLQHHASQADYLFHRLYRNLYNPDFFLLAYQNLYANQGAMTPGADGTTLDDMSQKRIESLIRTLKDRSYHPQPARRQYIPKKSGGLRPLGIPSANDKLVQEVVRMLLESMYEPTFSKFSHGFRPGRSCHTALAQVQHNFTGMKWFIEGDIKAYFDTIDHHTLVNILRRRIKDEEFLTLIWKFLKAGYLDQWQWHATYSGSPQGSGLSPLLANLYLHELDQFMAEYQATFNRGTQRIHNKDYGRLNSLHQQCRKHYAVRWDAMTREERDAARRDLRKIRAAVLRTPSKDPMDANYRRIQYVRYADDFLVGVIGSHADAEVVKADIGQFLAAQLKLTLSPEKTLITHARHKARFLGYDVMVSNDNATRRTRRGQVRVFSQRVRLEVPKDRWMGKLQALGVLKITGDAQGHEHWKPLQRDDLMGLEPREIVTWYNAQIRGMYNYYRLAHNASVLQKFYYVLEYSLYKTFAGKFRTTVAQAKNRFTHAGIFSVEYATKSGPRRVSLYGGGFPRIQTPLLGFVDILPERRNMPRPKELFFRMKATRCELCGASGIPVSVHQVRNLKSLTGQSEWERTMLKMRRKTLVVCEPCHAGIHAL